MNTLLSRNLNVTIRPVQYRDLDDLQRLTEDNCTDIASKGSLFSMQWLRHWFGVLKFLSWFPNPLQHQFCGFVAEQGRMLLGMIQVSPFNRTRSTWRVERVILDRIADKQGIGSQLLRHCFESILEARTWLLEVNINDVEALALYRQNGFQRLAEMTYWQISPELLKQLAQAEPDLPNLLPVSNADAPLLYQLDTASMPPLVRQVFDRHTHDFKSSLFGVLVDGFKQWMSKTEVVSGYVFEPQRKAAIGYFQVQLDRKGENPHIASLTVHPAYTWLYPELLSQLARIAQDFPEQGLQLASSDYQPEREEYLERIGAERIEHTLIMSRSVWHKIRESKFVSLEGLQWTEVLQGLQPARKPIPGGMSWLPKDSSPSERPVTNNSEIVAFSDQQFHHPVSNEHLQVDNQEEDS